ncbi:MAG: hypothetical protein HY367_00190 [Candidatus Aenigmarchaeota archaeon]|nr:hypothetical protein [Candidatus Aenigmarchaeota archaeon]
MRRFIYPLAFSLISLYSLDALPAGSPREKQYKGEILLNQVLDVNRNAADSQAYSKDGDIMLTDGNDVIKARPEHGARVAFLPGRGEKECGMLGYGTLSSLEYPAGPAMLDKGGFACVAVKTNREGEFAAFVVNTAPNSGRYAYSMALYRKP